MSFVECRQWRRASQADPDCLPPTLLVVRELGWALWRLPHFARWQGGLKRYAVRTVWSLNNDPQQAMGAVFHEVLVFAGGLSGEAKDILTATCCMTRGGGYFDPVDVTRLPMGWRA